MSKGKIRGKVQKILSEFKGNDLSDALDIIKQMVEDEIQRDIKEKL